MRQLLPLHAPPVLLERLLRIRDSTHVRTVVLDTTLPALLVAVDATIVNPCNTPLLPSILLALHVLPGRWHCTSPKNA